MKTGKFVGVAMSDPTVEQLTKMPRLAVGDHVLEPTYGMVVHIDEDTVVVARRNARGRCMEIVLVGDAIRTLLTT